MSVLRAVRLLLFGETWWIPAGLAAILLAGALAKRAAPDLWHETGGFAMLAAVIALLVTAVAHTARGR
jgi:hypothetical protein